MIRVAGEEVFSYTVLAKGTVRAKVLRWEAACASEAQEEGPVWLGTGAQWVSGR